MQPEGNNIGYRQVEVGRENSWLAEVARAGNIQAVRFNLHI